uniref:Gypsy retrotransposon integrase-like protein 1 n=1 Tax=Oryzias sinensis TaxID=183150 RepID=A0A8C7WTG9_9TELE
MQSHQKEDADICADLAWLERRKSRPPRRVMRGSSLSLRKLWAEFNRLSVVDGLLCRTVTSFPSGSKEVQVVVPSALVPDILGQLHGGPVAAHFSAERVWEQARQSYYWPGMLKDIRQWCEQGRACQTRRSPVPKAKAPMGESPVSRPLQRVAADILELPLTSRGHRYVLVVEDYFTKFVNVYALPNQTAKTVARCLFEDYVPVHGVPEVPHSDQCRQFEAEVIQNLCRLLGIAKTRTVAYNPKSDGMLAKMLLSHGGECDDHLKSVAFAYNTSKHSSTRFTPFYLMHGREARILAEVLIPSGVGGIGSAVTLPSYASSLVERLEIALSAARVNAAEAQEKQKLCVPPGFVKFGS